MISKHHIVDLIKTAQTLVLLVLQAQHARPQSYNTFVMSTPLRKEISNAHKYQNSSNQRNFHV